MANTSISSTVKRYPDLPYEKIKDHILGKSYRLELTFVGETRARNLNRKYRGKAYVPNVLTFPLADRHGEIYITPKRAEIEAKHYAMTPRQFVGYLFIHGCLHLKGYTHGATMERTEQRWLKKFKLRS